LASIPPFSRASNLSTPPLRFQAAMARRSASASAAEKPAAIIEISITCSWKIGMPSVRSSAFFRRGSPVSRLDRSYWISSPLSRRSRAFR
jgi:hypothetical protein